MAPSNLQQKLMNNILEIQIPKSRIINSITISLSKI